MKWTACLVAMVALTTTPDLAREAARAELHWLAKHSRTPAIRSLRAFAESELVVPKGRYRGTKLRSDRQPFFGLLFDAVDSKRWRRYAVLGCVQSGKTLGAFLAPILKTLFEDREPCGVLVPSQELSRDKWANEIKPTIEASRYRDLLPESGAGSKGGFSEEVRFSNGAHLRFLSGSGSDAKRSGQTYRVVCGTEVDKYDKAAASSREADPISQGEARTESYGDDAQLWLECTVSITKGRIWREYSAGTASRIACRCPHCREYVTPEREHLVGWQQAKTAREASRLAYFACPSCGHKLSEKERIAMNRAGVLVHRGQTVDSKGRIHGDAPDTNTLGFRWNAFNNLFWTPGHIAAKEWSALNESDAESDESTEKYLCQFVWAVPYQPPAFDDDPLDAKEVRRRFAEPTFGRGVVPADTAQLTVGCDLGKRFGTWTAIAWRPECRGHVIDYGTFEILSDDLGVERAMRAALRDMRDRVWLAGWRIAGDEANVMLPGRVLVDARYEGDTVRAFSKEATCWKRILPSMGYGLSVQHREFRRPYSPPAKTTKTHVYLGQHYHIDWDSEKRAFVVMASADDWKTWLFKRLRTPPEEPGSLVLFHSSDRNEHTTFAKQLTAERPEMEFVPGRGEQLTWKVLSRQNHYLDATYNACVAGHLAGVRLVKPPAATEAKKPARQSQPLVMPDGRPYMPNLDRF